MIEILNPPKIEHKGARKVSPLGKREYFTNQELEEAQQRKLKKQQLRLEAQLKKASWRRKIRNAKNAVKVATKTLEKKKAELEFLLNALA